jgi:iron complex outermembrane recepter protein
VAKAERPDWRAGVDYHLTDDVMGYFQFSTGYRSGGFNSRPFDTLQLGGYGPENLKAFEVGVKSEFLDHRLRFNGDVYTMNYNRIIVPLAQFDAENEPWTHYVNEGSAKDQGIELEATATPIDNLVIDANYSLTELKTNPGPGAVDCPSDGADVCGPGVTGQYLDGCSDAGFNAGLCSAVAPGTVLKGTSPILFPKNQAHFDVQYTFHMDDAGALTPRLDYNYQSTIYQDANNNKNTAIPARGLLNARLTWEAPTGGWQASFAVSNLADKKYFLDMFDLALFGEGTVEAQPAPGREWTLTLRKNF